MKPLHPYVGKRKSCSKVTPADGESLRQIAQFSQYPLLVISQDECVMSNGKYKGVKYCLERESLLQTVHKQIFDTSRSCFHFDQSVLSLFASGFGVESLSGDFCGFVCFSVVFYQAIWRQEHPSDSRESANVTLQQEEILLLQEIFLLFDCLLPFTLKYNGQMMCTP